METDPAYEVRGPVGDDELSALHQDAFGQRADAIVPWNERLATHSLSWVTARIGHRLVGFVNVAWDGGTHAFLLDTVVHGQARHRGVGTELVRRAAAAAHDAGCTWLHVDFEPPLRPFYVRCGFGPTEAGLLRLGR